LVGLGDGDEGDPFRGGELLLNIEGNISRRLLLWGWSLQGRLVLLLGNVCGIEDVDVFLRVVGVQRFVRLLGCQAPSFLIIHEQGRSLSLARSLRMLAGSRLLFHISLLVEKGV
jgi:hypothetical protein